MSDGKEKMLPRKLLKNDKFIVLYDLWNQLIDHLQSSRPGRVVRLHNTASENGVAGMLTIGSRRKQIADQEWPPKAGVVILDITYDDKAEDYTATFSLEETLPETKDEKRYILRIAEISYNNDMESWSAAQIHPVGDIEVLGRWVK